MIIVLFFLAIIVIFILMAVSLYNRLVRLRNNREQAFADVDVQLKQRHDLIPQLVDSVKGYMGHERGVLTDITEARTNAMKATTINEKIEAENKRKQQCVIAWLKNNATSIKTVEAGNGVARVSRSHDVRRFRGDEVR